MSVSDNDRMQDITENPDPFATEETFYSQEQVEIAKLFGIPVETVYVAVVAVLTVLTNQFDSPKFIENLAWNLGAFVSFVKFNEAIWPIAMKAMREAVAQNLELPGEGKAWQPPADLIEKHLATQTASGDSDDQ